MKTKFKDFLLYSLACVGAVSLFLSAYQTQQTTQDTWHMTNIYGGGTSITYMWNVETGEAYRIRGTEKAKVK